MAKEHTGTRLEPEEMVRVAEFARTESKPGFELTFSHALRVLILRGLEASLESLRHAHEKDAQVLKQQEKSLRILDEVPCGDSFPGCKFIKDAFKQKDRVDPQRDRVQRALDRIKKAEGELGELVSGAGQAASALPVGRALAGTTVAGELADSVGLGNDPAFRFVPCDDEQCDTCSEEVSCE